MSIPELPVMGALPRVEDFPDPDDEVLFPVLAEWQVRIVAERAERKEYDAGQVLFDQGQPEVPFYVIESGAVNFYDRRPGEKQYIAQARAGTFIGDIAIFTGEPSIAKCVAAEPCRVLALTRPELRRLMAEVPSLGDLLLLTMTARRDWMEGHGYGRIRIVGSRFERESYELRDFLTRNRVPNSWYDAQTDEDGRILLDSLGLAADQTPVLVGGRHVLRQPDINKVASKLGLRVTVEAEPYDVVILGAGPAGLAAAVYGASEGLRTIAFDAYAPGGQAGTSTRIDNYLGFPTGLSGTDLADRATLQARRFGATLSSLHTATAVRSEGPVKHVELNDGQSVHARAVVIATGAEYRRLPIENAPVFEGAGLYYGATHMEAVQCVGDDVVVVGGGNSAGQAALHLAGYARRVYLVVRRRSLDETMSRYLIDRIARKEKRIGLVPFCEPVALHGNGRLEAVTLMDRRDRTERVLPANAVFAMIGGVPRNDALAGLVGLDDRGFVVTGADARAHPQFAAHWDEERDPDFLETTRCGVFAVGDVRSGSTKRVASAVGEGSMAIALAHQVIDRSTG